MTLRLLRESGEPINSTTDVGDFVVRCAASGEWRLLGTVDEVGDTYFDSAQMPDLLADWDEAWALVSSFPDENCWHKVRALLVECEAGPRLCLHCSGD